MGKGDQRSRRGKIHRGTFGRRRPKRNKVAVKPAPAAESAPKKVARKEAPRRRVDPGNQTVGWPFLALSSMRFPFRNKVNEQTPASVKVISDGTAGAPHFVLGRRGEALAVEHLERVGYRIVAANFSLPIGRNTRGVLVNGEIDVVAYDGPTLCFVEVKTRASAEFAAPQVNVDRRKRRQIARAARGYRRMLGLMDEAHRYDVVTVVLPEAEKPIDTEPRIELLKNFWTDAGLRKRTWHEARWD
jgi:putative endonuclease